MKQQTTRRIRPERGDAFPHLIRRPAAQRFFWNRHLHILDIINVVFLRNIIAYVSGPYKTAKPELP